MKKTISNHAFEYVMTDFLKAKSGINHFKLLCKQVLAEHGITDFNISLMNVFKVGNDSELSSGIKSYRFRRTSMLIPKIGEVWPETVLMSSERHLFDEDFNIQNTLKNSDLFIIISDNNRTVGFVGEVEGNNGDVMFSASYYKKKPEKDKYCTFGVSVSDRKKLNGIILKNSIEVVKSEETGRWLLNFSKSHSFSTDYYYSIDNIQALLEGHYGYQNKIEDEGHKSVLEIIKKGWEKDVVDLIMELEEFLDFAYNKKVFYYQEDRAGEIEYRPSSLVIPGEVPLYSLE
jgi:predicted secreted protein